MVFVGNRSETTFKKSFRIDSESILQIKDKLGIKLSNVYFLRRLGEDNNIITQILPTPTVRQIESDVTLESGGVDFSGAISLQNIPKSKYSRADLDTSTPDGKEERYYIVNGRAYTLFHIKASYLFWELFLRQYEPAENVAIPS